MSKPLVFAAFCAAQVGCSGAPEDYAASEGSPEPAQAGESAGAEAVGKVTQEIKDGSKVTLATGLAMYIAKLGGTDWGCTGTIVGPRHVLTAAHCSSGQVGNVVGFYTPDNTDSGSPDMTSSEAARIERVYLPFGVSTGDWKDDDGDFADYRVVYLDRAVPSRNRAAAVAWHWPGRGVDMYQIGAGEHDGTSNSSGKLRYRSEETFTINDNDGAVLLRRYTTEDGDSGGPILRYDADLNRHLVFGALHGGHFYTPYLRTRYTSTNFHFRNILRAIGHVSEANVEYTGATNTTTSSISRDECASRCMARPACKAYSWDPGPALFTGTCQEKDARGNSYSETGSFSGYKLATGVCNTVGTSSTCRL